MIVANLKQLKDNVPATVTVVAVSKTKPADAIQLAYEAGHLDFGENKVQELCQKHELLPKDIRWHMIGHLQKNKVKYISEFISLIHSLDRLSLANEIDKNGKKHDKSIDCLIQIKISKEETKFGLNIDELDSFYNEVKKLNNVNIVGLMGMATFTDDKDLINAEFKEIEKLFEKIKTIDSNFKILSIGMSDDYLLAIQNGSNMIRVGSRIFGKRNY